jgi:DNA adenine methylase
VLRYHGGKWKLAPWIVAHFPPHRIYVEPFGGGASVLLRKRRSYAEVYNDRWSTVVNVFRVLRDAETAAQLADALRLTPFARDEFDACGESDIEALANDVERARRTILRSFAGFGSASTNARYSTGFRSNSNRSGTTPARDWANYPALIPSFVERLQGVVIENRHALEVIAQHDTPQTLFYVDPPYLHATRNMQRGNAAYEHEMEDVDHRQLASALHKVRGMVVLSGYQSDLYDELYGRWRRFECEAHADGARKRTEVLWLNAPAARKCGAQGALAFA